MRTDKSITLPANFTANVVIEESGRAGQMAVHDNGAIYVQLRKLTDDHKGETN